MGGLRDYLNQEYFNTFDDSNDICHTLKLALAIENRWAGDANRWAWDIIIHGTHEYLSNLWLLDISLYPLSNYGTYFHDATFFSISYTDSSIQRTPA